MKRFVTIILTMLLVVSLAACSAQTAVQPADTAAAAATEDPTAQADTAAAEQTATPVPIKVAIVLTTSGLGDKNFCDMSYQGLLQAQEDFGIEFDYLEPTSASDFESMHRMLAESGEYDLIIGLAADQLDAITAVATDFPDQKWSYIDATLDMPNVSSISTKWPEQTFLCGVVAGLATQSRLEQANADNIVGVILGMDYPLLREGVVGFAAGVRYVNPDCQVLEGIVNGFGDPATAKEIALSMYNRGADMIQHIAGASGLGVFTAAEETNMYAFGVGGNQNYLSPDHIIATSIRNVNEIVYNEVKAAVEGTWTPGPHVSGMVEGSVGYSTEGSNIVLPDDIVTAVEETRQKIVSGELAIPSTADELDAWVAANQYGK